MTKASHPKTRPRRRSKYFADGSALIAVKDGGIVLVESQGQYKAAGPKDDHAKPRCRSLRNVLTESAD